MKKKIDIYKMPPREVEIHYTLWDARRPLIASEIANEELKLATVHTTLKRMLKKDVLEVVDFAKSGNVYGRCYQPTISLMEFEMSRLCELFLRKKCKEITLASFVAEMLKGMDDADVLKELDELEKVIKQKRMELMDKK